MCNTEMIGTEDAAVTKDPVNLKNGSIKGLAGMPDTKRFNTPEEMRAIRERLEEAVKREFRRLDLAKRKSIESASRCVLD